MLFCGPVRLFLWRWGDDAKKSRNFASLKIARAPTKWSESTNHKLGARVMVAR